MTLPHPFFLEAYYMRRKYHVCFLFLHILKYNPGICLVEHGKSAESLFTMVDIQVKTDAFQI
jgi:hypothetical protein